jgi:hypothetical protein
MTKLLRSVKPTNVLIEQTALNLAAVFYEACRRSGLTSKHKNARAFAKANLEKFIPKAVDLLLDILGKTDPPEIMKADIHEALTERVNDPELNQYMPKTDVTAFIDKHVKNEQQKVLIIETAKKQATTVLHKRTN